MKFVGQHHIMRQLQFLLPRLYESQEDGCNILLRGPSGFGKTTMALGICRYLAGSSFQVFLGDWTEFNFRKRVIFIDEVHKVEDIESLYHIMDSREHVLLFATNADSNLPEAFVNRCYQYIFDDYTDEELLIIAMEASSFHAPESSFLEIVNAGNRNPRIIKSLCERLGIYFQQNGDNSETADFSTILREVFSIEDGLDTLSRRYIETLNSVGGTASINLLRSLLHVDSGTLQQEVEPVLLSRGLLRITSKGRSLVYDD